MKKHATAKPKGAVRSSVAQMSNLVLQRKPADKSAAGEVPPIVHEVLRSGAGQPLDPATRASMEPRLGHDFSRVRVHTDAKAAESARAVNARAYTVGRQIVMGAGQYAPGTTAGRGLLAHELAHVVQQPGGLALQTKLEIGRANGPSEDQADGAAEAVLNGRATAAYRFASAGAGESVLRRAPADEGTAAAASAPEAKPAEKKDDKPKKICGPDVTDWLVGQIQTNAKSSEVAKMSKANSEDIKGVDLGALAQWYNLVRTGARWDFKKDLGAPISKLSSCRQNCSGKLYSITIDGQCMTYEVAANIHFGYVGRAAGFTEEHLLGGASEAQVSEGRGETKDDPRDVQAIKKGFELFNAGSPKGLNKSGLDANYYQNLPAGDGDPAGCEPCSTKL
jgi:hypothetical protein